jgi:hypothetical protein
MFGNRTVGRKPLMKNAFRYLIIVTFMTCLSISIGPRLANAQSGSAGGSIGNDDKAVSGSRNTPPRSVEEPDRTPRRSKDDSDESQRASRKSGAGGGGGESVGVFDGAWAVLIIGGPACQGTVAGAVVISSGRIIGDGISSGRVSPNGSTYTAGATKEGLTYTTSGRLSGRSGSGSFRRSDGCTGRWTASKQ